jgi:tol-pal system protein YbgF
MNKILITFLGVFSFLFLAQGCASKKYDIRLQGIQKQITYLTESYENLSGKLGEIQDTLVVVQNEIESTKAENPSRNKGDERKAKPQSKASTSVEENARKPREDEEKKLPESNVENTPVFDLGAENPQLAGKPGEVFKLNGGEGYIKIEDGKKKNNAPKIMKELSGVSSFEDPEDFYKNSLAYYSARKFEKAIESFNAFLKLFPDHRLVDNAIYWIGESYVGQGEYALALPEFQRIQLQYPNGNKVPDAFLMIGICFDKMKNRESAKDSWTKLVALFPNSMAAKKAKKKLENLDSSKTM